MSERSAADESRLTDLTCVVTGAASERGIGRGVALALAGQGRPLALLDLDGARLAHAAEAVRAAGSPAVVTAEVDVADEASVAAAISAVESARASPTGPLPPIGALVHCAGVADPTPFLEMTSSGFQRTLAINTLGLFHLARRVLPGMLDQGLGRIVAMSSTAAQDGGGNFSTSAYAASKAGVEGLIRGLAKEVAGTGVTTAAIAPANIDTDIMGGALVGQRREEFVARTPVGRLGTTRELGELVAFLVGPHGGFTTGATYNLNGGLRVG
ncbi:SDR family NAD(P)-dependent oxidoreductase [Brachybacterium sacelli]|uniref:NAD(P)-dependent dehydrogenase (Short-subunit alcohol dehydrogenase family) n=1 Tax=Brachybacterium sacelli TaxID=173364 RepID=A0ABS4WXL1_9MICO|nr:SDR family oxidoreductase [Brachybacterium sacelli]MBP2380898.1 NAD(P)-dependent dehydrogenase (short-subunit alcohol dehydrogenase family) [Brachybacterium sacelli]